MEQQETVTKKTEQDERDYYQKRYEERFADMSEEELRSRLDVCSRQKASHTETYEAEIQKIRDSLQSVLDSIENEVRAINSILEKRYKK